MAEAGDFELFGAPAAKEHDEKSDEQFREEMKRAQQAMQQLQKEEGKARAHDDRLAHIIVQFLSQQGGGGTDLFLLISRCVAQDIPSELIIAVLSLVDRTASEEIQTIIKEAGKTALALPEYKDVHALNPAQKMAIDKWIGNITVAAAHKPHRTLDSVLIKSVTKNTNELIKEISPPFVQLSAFIMRNFLTMQETHIDVSKLRDFMENVYFKMLTDLEEMMQGQRKLENRKKA
ncbi:hypothetical protein KJ657_00505 [Patescibacteria group bacterium]|nr:hypothetical protein [Patescibacteria group bacterium]MBU1015557.1 hypothetical protein [Patescibacteria group bacterium]MBU1685608.1 hypothetical protein [Patescibacteria group bacterium]MBU1938974.1 hypothetical protein [Patescibacteria group bacterium]